MDVIRGSDETAGGDTGTRDPPTSDTFRCRQNASADKCNKRPTNTTVGMVSIAIIVLIVSLPLIAVAAAVGDTAIRRLEKKMPPCKQMKHATGREHCNLRPLQAPIQSLSHTGPNSTKLPPGIAAAITSSPGDSADHSPMRTAKADAWYLQKRSKHTVQGGYGTVFITQSVEQGRTRKHTFVGFWCLWQAAAALSGKHTHVTRVQMHHTLKTVLLHRRR